MVRAGSLGLVALVLGIPPLGAAVRTSGHVKATALHSTLRGAAPAAQQALDLRLKWAGRWRGGWEARFHYQVRATGGEGRAGDLLGSALPDDRGRLFRLARRQGSGHWQWVQRIDRLSLGYARGRNVLRLGRQVVGWGYGLVFQPMDFLNPFPPAAVDTEYKTGDDMVYAQHLWDGGGDLQAVWVGRRDPASGRRRGAVATWAVKQRFLRGGATLDLMAARHYGEEITGVGLASDWRGGVVRLDLLRAGARTGAPAWLGVANADRSWTWRGRNVYGYLEYFRNGFGSATADPARADDDLVARLTRGELFTLGRDYLAAGLRVEWTPRLQFEPLVIANLNDRSGLLQGRLRWAWRQDVDLDGAVLWTWGGATSEFGGFVSQRTSAYIRASLYF